MFKHSLIIAMRNILKYWRYALINVIGLAIGLSTAIFIFLYIDDELKYDRFHEKADRIYRVNRFYNTNQVNEDAATLEFPGGPAMMMDYPDIIENMVRLFNFQRSFMFFDYEKSNGEKQRFNESRFFLADSTFFDIFTFPFVAGDPNTALDRPSTIVITESTAKKYFGDEPAIGKVLRLEEQANFEVTGVIKDLPSQSHFKIDLIGSLSTFRLFLGGQLPQTWVWNPCWTYVLLKPGIKQEVLDEKFPEFYKNHYDDLKDQDVKLYLQPLTDIHLKSHHVYEMHPNSNILYVYILSIVAVIVLILACINFMNLSTASSAGRAKEIGIKKVHGSHRSQLIYQFMGEALIQTLLALVLALLFVELFRTGYNNFSGKSISNAYLLVPENIVFMVLLVFSVGIFSGTYPALFLSSFQPLVILKGTLKSGVKSALARKILVILQFSISISLIIGTLVVFSQLNFLRNAELGFKKDHIITFQNTGPLFRNYQAFKEELLRNKDIQYVTGAEDVLGVNHNTRSYVIEGLPDGQNNFIPTFMVDWDFLETFDIKVVEGRGFSREFPADTIHSVMINETMVKDLGWTNESAIGKRIQSQDGDERVIGVFKDFNAMSLHRPVSKFILDMFRRPQVFSRTIAVRFNASNYQEVLKHIESTWTKFNPSRPFEYRFFDSQLNELYKDDNRFGKFTLILTILAIVIACLGLIGLTSFLAEQRTKEIGIRRVMGSTPGQIVQLMYKEFVVLVSLAIVIAWPVTWYATQHWLENYSRHVSLNPLLFLISALIALFLTLIIVGYRALKTSAMNPSETLRYE